MDTDPPQTPDVDLPGQQPEQADLDIVVQPEPGAAAGTSDEPDAPAEPTDDPEAGNTLIRPENS